MDILHMTACDIRDAVAAGTITAGAVTTFFLDRIERLDGTVRAFVSVDREGALAAAAAVDAKLAAGKPVGRLAGVPVAVKDNICLDGGIVTCSSRMLADFKAPYDAHVVERLRAEDAVILGKTNLDEFAMGSSTENSAFGTTRNPWDTARIPGGSSGGSAAAVAAGFAPLAIGSDTGGSIRQPASLTGVIGMKPTYGMVSRHGLIAFGSSLDQIGPFARTAEDAALLLDCLAGHDGRDATSRKAAPPACGAALDTPVKGLRIGIPHEYFAEGLDPEVERLVRAAATALEQAGATLVDISLPSTEYAVPVYYVVATAEASSNLGRFDGVHYGHRATGTDNIISLYAKSRDEGFGAEVKRRIMLGTFVLSAGYYDAYYLRALKVRTRIAEEFKAAFNSVDAILSPTSPCAAFRVGEKSDDPLAMYLSDIYTISANLAGIPGISVPAGVNAEGLPVGVQLMATHFRDDLLFTLAATLEKALAVRNQVAPL